jgi:hypothetical protein
MRKPVPLAPPAEPGRAQWIAFAVAQGMSIENAVTVDDDALRRWFEEEQE